MVNQLVEQNLIESANNFFKKSQFATAIELYSEALEKSGNTSIRAYLNRSAAYLKQEKYYLAFIDAHRVTELDESNEKAFFRMGKSAYSMRQYETAKQHFESCLKISKQNQEAMFELNKTKLRINESTKGEYDLESLSKEVFARVFGRKTLNFDLADFKSNKISVVDIPNKSKGIIANEYIKKGTLLFASKALSAVFKYTNSGGLEATHVFDDLVSRMKNDPFLSKQVYSLLPGPGFSRDDRIDEESIDHRRIFGICNTNVFKINLKQFNFNIVSQFFNSPDNLTHQVAGLWYIPSFLNHSCIANASMDFLGDMFFLFAREDIAKNEEITINYMGCNKTILYSGRIECLKDYHFKCDCRLCCLDEKDEKLNERNALIQELHEKNSNFVSISLKKVLEDVKLMEKTYSKRPDLQLGMVIALQNLACKYRHDNEWKKSAETWERIYMVAKETLERPFLICVLHSAYCDYAKCFERKLSLSCKKKAPEFYEERHKRYFEMIWSEFDEVNS